MLSAINPHKQYKLFSINSCNAKCINNPKSVSFSAMNISFITNTLEVPFDMSLLRLHDN